MVVGVTVVGLVFFYTIPVAFIQGFCNMSTLESIFGSGFVDWINSLPGVQALLESILPTLAMKIFIILLPPICYCMCHTHARNSQLGKSIGKVLAFSG